MNSLSLSLNRTRNKQKLLNESSRKDDDYDDQYDGIGDDGGVAGGIGGLDDGLYDVDVHNVHKRHDNSGSSSRGGAKNEQEAWRRYNAVVKDIVADAKFWEGDRNTNRDGGGGGRHGGGAVMNSSPRDDAGEYDIGGGDEDGGETRYRGPDKGKGGRLIGPDGKYLPIKRGGQRGRGVPAVGVAGDGGGNPGRGAGNRRGGRGDVGGGGRGRGGGSDTKGGGSDGDRNEGDAADLSKVQKRRKNDNKAKIGNHHRKDRATKKASGGMIM
jgi:hypothetical protein